MTLGDHSAVGGAVKVGFSPIPGRVAADGPPGRPGYPDADAENESDKSGGEDPDPVFAVVAGVSEAEERRGHPGRLPETGAVSVLKMKQQAWNQPQQGNGVNAPGAVASHAYDQAQAHGADQAHGPPEVDAAGERRKQKAAHQAFFHAANEEEDCGPPHRKDSDLGAVECYRAEMKPPAQGQSAHQRGESDKSGYQAGGETRQGVGASQVVIEDAPTLQQSHKPGGRQHREKAAQFREERSSGGDGPFHRANQMELRECVGEAHVEEEEQQNEHCYRPEGSDTLGADEDPVQAAV